MSKTRSRTWLDYAVWGAAGLLVMVVVYLAYAAWAQNRYNEATSPAGRAVTNLQELVKKQPNDIALRVRLAQALTAAGRTQESIEQYNAALKIQKDNPYALTGLGLLAMDAKQWSAAEGYWRKIIQQKAGGQYAGKDEQLEGAYYYLALALMEQKRYEESVSNLQEALRIRRDASDTHYALSVVYAKLGSTDKSQQELRNALLFDPTMPEANYDLGQLLLARGDVAGAAEHFRLAADKAPGADKPRRALEALGTADGRLVRARELRASNPASATVEARVAAALDPNDADAVRFLAELYDQRKMKAEALGAYNKLLVLVPGDKQATAAAARLKTKGGK